MVPASMTTHNPFKGLTVDGVRESFEECPVKSAAAVAVFGGSLLWALKAAKKNGPVGAAIKGMIAVALMNKAKKALLSAQNGRRRMAY
jgi:hypothetical protein